MHPVLREFHFPAPGAELFAVEVGDPARRPLVLLHGGPGASHDYLRPQLDRLGEAGYRVVYYDQRGGGRSLLPAGAPYGTVADHVADLEALRLWLGVEQLTLGGYSWGGLLAQRYALAHPGRVARLLLIATAPAQSLRRIEMKQRMAEAAARPSVAALRQTLDMTDRKNRFAVAVAGYFVDPRRALELTPFLVRDRAEQAVWQSLGDYDLLPALGALRLRALLLHGVDDPIPIEGARDIATALAAPLIEIPDCAHVPFIEGATTFFDAALDFLR